MALLIPEERITQLETLERRLTTIAYLNKALLQTQDEHAILNAISGLTQAQNAQMSAVSFLDDGGKISTLVAVQDHVGQPIPLHTLPMVRFEIQQVPHLRLALESPDSLLLISNVQTDPRVEKEAHKPAREFGLSAYILMILRTPTGCPGMLSFGWMEPQEFAPEFIAILCGIRTTAAAMVAYRRLQLELAQPIQKLNELPPAQILPHAAPPKMPKPRTSHSFGIPIVPLIEGIVLLPLVENISAAQAENTTRALLKAAADYRARIAIVDITGIPMMDSRSAHALNQMIQAVQLKGIYPIITGVHAATAETITDLNLDWGRAKIFYDLQAGFFHALKHLGITVQKRTLSARSR